MHRSTQWISIFLWPQLALGEPPIPARDQGNCFVGVKDI